jgi:hypothetical protein
MNKTLSKRYKEIYVTEVLPKKSVTVNSPLTFEADIQIYKEFTLYRKDANSTSL